MKYRWYVFVMAVSICNIVSAGSGSSELYDRAKRLYPQNIDEAVSVAEELLIRYPSSNEADEVRQTVPRWRLEQVAKGMSDTLKRLSSGGYSGGKVVDNKYIDQLIKIVEDYPDHKLSEGIEASIVGFIFMNEMLPAMYSIKKKSDQMSRDIGDVVRREGDYDQMLSWRVDVMIKTLDNQVDMFSSMISAFNSSAGALRTLSVKHSLSDVFSDMADLFEHGAYIFKRMIPVVENYLSFYRREGYNCVKAQNSLKDGGFWENIELNKKILECKEKEDELKEKMAPIQRELDSFKSRKDAVLEKAASAAEEFRALMKNAMSEK
ncbi:hypothetical protein [Endothiovibrio diazotrophicus]